MTDFIGRVKDAVRVLSGKEPSYLLRNLKMGEGVIIGDTHVYITESHLSSHIAVRIFTPKDNKITFLNKDGEPTGNLRGEKKKLIMLDEVWSHAPDNHKTDDKALKEYQE